MCKKLEQYYKEFIELGTEFVVENGNITEQILKMEGESKNEQWHKSGNGC